MFSLRLDRIEFHAATHTPFKVQYDGILQWLRFEWNSKKLPPLG